MNLEKTYLAVFLIFIISTKSYSQNVNKKDSMIIWDKSYRLNYSDFLRKKKDSLDFANARASAGLIYNPMKIHNNHKYSYDYYVFSVFNRYKSFMVNKNKAILEHEQLHFDIAELIARKLRKHISLKDRTKKYYKIANNYVDSLNTYNYKFDIETTYGNNIEQQKKWKEKIKLELDKLKKYSGVKVK